MLCCSLQLGRLLESNRKLQWCLIHSGYNVRVLLLLRTPNLVFNLLACLRPAAKAPTVA